MNKSYYKDYFYLERNHWWFLARKKILHDYISGVAGQRKLKILNIGAATGASSVMLSEFGEVTSIEYDADCCRFVEEETGMKFVCASITDLPYENASFDMVCAFDVVEHIDDDQKAVDEMYRVCRNDGYLLCTVPAYQFLWSHHDEVNMHYRRYTLGRFKKLFTSGKIMFGSYFNFLLFFPIAAFRLIDRMLKIKSIRKKAGSDFTITENKTLDKIFYKIMVADNFFFKSKISLPFGISAFLAVKK